MTARAKTIAASDRLAKPCGLNADWSVRAWHLGPGKVPNMTDGDVYILDDEQGGFSVVRRWYEREGGEVEVVGSKLSISKAVKLALKTIQEVK